MPVENKNLVRVIVVPNCFFYIATVQESKSWTISLKLRLELHAFFLHSTGTL
jgi:hypothetical protein